MRPRYQAKLEVSGLGPLVQLAARLGDVFFGEESELNGSGGTTCQSGMVSVAVEPCFFTVLRVMYQVAIG